MKRSGKRVHDETHLTWIRSLPCSVCGRTPCGVAHHRTGAGKGLKADDSQTLPLCDACHRDFHDHRGHFRRMTKDEKNAWQDSIIEKLTVDSSNVF